MKKDTPRRKRFNWKSREKVNTIIDDSEQKKIKVEFEVDHPLGYDSSNALVLPSAKRKTIKKRQCLPTKLLSKKHVKRLKKIIETKEKKLQIEELVKDLQNVQVKPEDLNCLTSLQETQTLGRKVFLNPSYTNICKLNDVAKNAEMTTSHLKWKEHPSIKKARKELQSSKRKIREKLPNYAGYTSSSSEDSDSGLEMSVIEHNLTEEQKELNNKVNQTSNEEMENVLICNDSKINAYKNESKIYNSDVENSENKKFKDNLEVTCWINKTQGEKIKNNKVISESKVSKSKKIKNREEVASKLNTSKNKKIKNKEESSEAEKRKSKKIKNKEEGTAEQKKSKNKKSVTSDTLKKRKFEQKNFPGETSVVKTLKESKINQHFASDIEPCVKKKKVDNSLTPVKKTVVKKKGSKNKIVEQDLGENSNELSVIELDSSQNKTKTRKFRILNRAPMVQKERLKLPILSEEHTVMEAINENPVTIIVGQTGSGKTTQVPQFLYEAGYTSDGKMIGVTEPRRVAAINMSERVAYEMGLSSKEVSYQVRFEGNQCEQTQIKFMTDGILLKEIQQDCFLKRFSVIVIDEAHERNVQSDILIGLLSKVIRKRKSMEDPLKLVIMSATLRIQDFTENRRLFMVPPPVVKIDGRVFAVNIYFNKVTNPDYVEAALKKVYHIHKQCPEGTILVFLTGQNEIHLLCDKLKELFPQPEKVTNKKKIHTSMKEIPKKRKKTAVPLDSVDSAIPEINLDDFVPSKSRKELVEDDETSDEGEDQWNTQYEMSMKGFNGRELEQPLEVLPLYARLPAHEQKKVFEPPPPGSRLCVLTTNVAETSLTIPNVKYVIDCGKIKQKVHDHVNGVSTFKIIWTSKASADQRSGRAGRVCNGSCYRLYSSAVFNDEFEDHTKPEILRKPIDDVVLILKSFRFSVTTFPYPSPPDPVQLQHGLKRLISMGALERNLTLFNKLKKLSPKDNFIDSTVITEQGFEMASLPVAPRFAKMIIQCNQFDGIMPYVILIISALTFEDFLVDVRMDRKLDTEWEQRLMNTRLLWSGRGSHKELGDLLVIANAVLEADRNYSSVDWCKQHGIRLRDIIEIRKLREQLTKFIMYNFPEVKLNSNLDLEPLSASKIRIIMQVILTGSSEFVAKKVNCSVYNDPLQKAKFKNSYRTIHSDEPVYISSLSVFHRNKPLPQYIMYQDVHRTTKTYLRGISEISSTWLASCLPLMCTFEPPLDKPQPRYISSMDTVVCHRRGTYGPTKWEILATEVPFPEIKDLYKWVSYFLLQGDICPYLKNYTQYLYDTETLILPVCIRYREIRENIIRALQSRNVKNRKTIEEIWKTDPSFLKNEYFAWFYNENPLYELRKKWPPLPESDLVPC